MMQMIFYVLLAFACRSLLQASIPACSGQCVLRRTILMFLKDVSLVWKEYCLFQIRTILLRKDLHSVNKRHLSYSGKFLKLYRKQPSLRLNISLKYKVAQDKIKEEIKGKGCPESLESEWRLWSLTDLESSVRIFEMWRPVQCTVQVYTDCTVVQWP